MQVVVKSLITNYHQDGSGPAVVLLHGWGDDSSTFRDLADSLSKNFTVIRLDLPGFGKTQPPEGVWGLNDYCDFVAEFLNKLGHTKIHGLVGHSNGGAIAIRGVGTARIKTDKLILLAASGIRDVYKGRKKLMRLIAKLAKTVTFLLPKSTQHKIKKKAYKTIGSDMFVAEHLQETFKKVVTDDVRKDCVNIGIPTLLIYGTKDEATPPSYGQKYHELLSNSKLEILDGSGHFVHHDQPSRVLKLTKEALA